MHAQRGQTIPVWIFGILTSMMLMVMVFNYGNSIRWQIRSQNAADAVAQGIVSVQAQHFNQMLITVHAAAIEEYRIRRTLNALLMVLQGSGGCQTNGTAPDCATAYNSLRNNYIAEVGRYGQLVQQMQAISNYTQTQQIADMNSIAQSFQTTCVSSGPTGGDCVFLLRSRRRRRVPTFRARSRMLPAKITATACRSHPFPPTCSPSKSK